MVAGRWRRGGVGCFFAACGELFYWGLGLRGGGANHSTGAHSTSYLGQIFYVPVPQVVEEILLVIQVIPQVRVSERIVGSFRRSCAAGRGVDP